MNGVGLYTYRKLDIRLICKGQIVESDGFVYKNVVVENSFGGHVKSFKLSELRTRYRPVVGREFAAAPAVIARRSVSGYFHVVY